MRQSRFCQMEYPFDIDREDIVKCFFLQVFQCSLMIYPR